MVVVAMHGGDGHLCVAVVIVLYAYVHDGCGL